MPTERTEGYHIETDDVDNRLYIDLTGRLSEDDIAIAAEETKVAVDLLRSGFDVVNDVSGFKPPSPEAAAPIKEAQQKIVENDVDTVVRIVDDETSQVVVNAFERRSRDVGYTGETADSVAEAERLLD